GSLKSGKSLTDTITVTARGTAGTITNTATVSPTDANPQNNTDSATTTGQTGQQSADLAITKTGPANVSTGPTVPHTLSVHNNGPSAAAGVSVTDVLPANLTFVSAGSGCSTSSGTVTCTVANLASGADATFTITVTAPTTAATVTNTATVSATSPNDPNTGNNSSSLTTMVQAGQQSADLAITKTGPASVTAGQTFTYTLAVHNNGPNAGSGVTVTDQLPSGLTYVSASSGCVNGSGTVTCTVASLANGADATFMITVTLTGPTTANQIVNTATVSVTSPNDPTTGNNSSSFTTAITTGQQSADLAITMTDSPDPVPLG